jgi:ribosomal protein S18 acetylase RimI-like enzyme
VDIRIARVEEYEHVGELTYNAYLPLFGTGKLGWYGRELRDVVSRAESAEIVVADIEGTAVGALAYYDDYSGEVHDSDAELVDCAGFRVLAVDPAGQGKGVGEALTRWCLERAGADGRAAVVLHTTDYMEAAQRLYRRVGFERFEDIDHRVEGKFPVEVLGFRYSLRP